MDIDDKYIDGEYFGKNPNWHVEDSPWKAKNICEILWKNSINPIKVAEIGCGVGEILVQMATRMPKTQFFGYEISPYAYIEAIKRQTTSINYSQENIFENKEVFFDVVMAIDVFEHIDNAPLFLKSIKQKGTYKVFHIPLDISVLSVLRPKSLMNAWHSVGHLNYYTRELALELLNYSGLEIIDQYLTNGALESSSNRIQTLIANVPRRVLQLWSKDLAARLLGGYSLLVLAK
jgi:SAM-dependent methyltransferase